MIAERLYQAIIDRSIENGIEFEAAAAACGFNPDELLECFDAKPDSRPLSIYDFLGRAQIEKTACFLQCPCVRIFFLADVFRTEDIRALASALIDPARVSNQDAMKTLVTRVGDAGAPAEEIASLADAALTGSTEAKRQMLQALAQYFGDISKARFTGHPEVIIDEFVASTFSESLEEACAKTGLPLDLLQRWRQREPATLKDLETMRAMANVIGLQLSPILLSLSAAVPGDLLWCGLPVDPMAELQKALDVDIW